MTLRRPHGIPVDQHEKLETLFTSGHGLARLAAVNHSVLGKRFMATGLVYFLIGGILAMLIRTQLAVPGNAFMDAEAYNQVFTMHGTVMMFLFTIPMLEGFALYLLPKMLGSRDLAFPRLSAFGYWCYLFGGLILLFGMLGGVAPDSGWFMYPPLSGAIFTPGPNTDVWLIGVTFVEVSALCAGAELTASILRVRTAGMAIHRMPIFAWYILVPAVMILLGFPPLVLASILLELERAFDWPFFDVARGGDPLLWQHLFWMFGHPEVYIIFLPAAGMVSTLLPVFAGRPLIGYTWIVVSLIATGFLSFGLWVHHMFTVGIPHLAQVFFSAASMMVAIPTAVQIFAWLATLWAGKPRLTVPMYYLGGFLFIFVAGGLTGVMLALAPFNWQVHDTQFVVAHLHYVLVGGLVFPLLAGAYYWMPHLTGRMPSERLGLWAFWLIFIGFNVTFLIMHLTGLIGMPRRVYTYDAGLGWALPNLVSSIGGFLMSAGFALFVIDWLLHARLGRPARRNPWVADTLEWAMPIPPPSYNIISQPVVSGRHPLFEDPELPRKIATGSGLLPAPDGNRRETLGVSAISGRPDHVILLPGPSWLPLAAALSLAVFFVSFLVRLYPLAAVGAAAALGCFLAWAWTSGQTSDPAPIPTGQGGTLPPHFIVHDAPGWWGLSLALWANGTLFASLVFGYVFLWVIAPNWPPPAMIPESPALAAATMATLAAGWIASRGALRRNAGGDGAGRLVMLVIVVLSGIAATSGFLSVPAGLLPMAINAHAYAAVVTVLCGYGAIHAGLGAVIAAYAIARCRAGYVSPIRALDIRILELWWRFTAVTGAIVVVALAIPVMS